MYLFILPIGDWAEDGHGRHHNTVVRADKAIEDVQIAYNQIFTKTGIDLCSVCSKYDDSEIPEGIWDKLRELGFNQIVDEYPYVDRWELTKIVVFLLNYVDADLNLEIMDVPKLHTNVGYGLFS